MEKVAGVVRGCGNRILGAERSASDPRVVQLLTSKYLKQLRWSTCVGFLGRNRALAYRAG